DVWAVGYHNIALYGSEKTMALHWNGSAWSIVPTPNIGRNANEFRAVAAAGPNDVWAVGFGASTSNEVGVPLAEHWDGPRCAVGESEGNSSGDSLVEHWDGTTWAVVPSKDGSKPFTALNGVVAVGGSSVWAVGATYDPISVFYRTFTEHWDGTAWTVVPSPN